MEALSIEKKTLKFSGNISLAGAVSMFAGAALWGASGTDLWQALANKEIESYLKQLESVKPLLVASTIFWTLGVLLLGTAGTLMSGFCISNPRLAQLALVCLRSAVPVAVVSFMIMISLAISPATTDIAYSIGWIGVRLDDLATLLIIGAFPLFVSKAGRND